jgi:hypothetical protein
MQKTIAELKSKNYTLVAEIDKINSDFQAHAISCETFRKTTKSRLKCVDGLDYTEEQAKSKQIGNEMNRLSKICQNLRYKNSQVICRSRYPAENPV